MAYIEFEKDGLDLRVADVGDHVIFMEVAGGEQMDPKWARLQEFERTFGDIGDTANNVACVDFTEGMWIIEQLKEAWDIASVPGEPYRKRGQLVLEDGTPPDYQAMWEDAVRHRDQAEKRARCYMDLYGQIADLIQAFEGDE